MRRPERMAETLREEIAEIVGFELEDPRLEAVTVTEVRVSDDLRNASVYVLADGEEKQKVEAMKALKNASSYVRQQLALSMSLHHAPQIHFIRDTVEEKATRIEQILEDLSDRDEFNKGKDDEE